ncbi:PREDICTED: scarecrow-like protein 23 [Ipomoea nil]|uniref:scarecrow-like protein 23 n=1 Tax=Ipomoea nil TaxID=35883 RepID=UPI0009014D2B|nr:PREDICTED: scarecrow-like protein 23 [Ipomoea nil]
MESINDEDEFLSLKLAIATQQPLGCERNKKRKRREDLVSISSYEEEIYSLLQIGEQMLNSTHKTSKESSGGREGLHLINLLLVAAAAVNDNNLTSAMANLSELCQNVSVLGDAIQRVSAYFAAALTARLLTQKSPFYHTIMKPPTSQEEFLAFTHLYKVSPLYQFAHFTANQAIIEAFENENKPSLHVIDFDISHGFQWPSLIQSLSQNITTTPALLNRISLRITGFATTLNELQETEARLLSFAKGFRNLSFEFHGLLKGSNLGNIVTLENETTAVNLSFHVNDNRLTADISETLKAVHSLRPSVVTVVEQDVICRKLPQSFLSRFMESLHYFAAMFDSLDDCLPIDSHERLSIENHLGREIKSVMNFDDQRHDERERVLLESGGFCEMELSSKNVMQAKLLLKIRSHSPSSSSSSSSSCVNNGGFRVVERDDGKGISLAWQDRCLITASAWQCCV